MVRNEEEICLYLPQPWPEKQSTVLPPTEGTKKDSVMHFHSLTSLSLTRTTSLTQSLIYITYSSASSSSFHIILSLFSPSTSYVSTCSLIPFPFIHFSFSTLTFYIIFITSSYRFSLSSLTLIPYFLSCLSL